MKRTFDSYTSNQLLDNNQSSNDENYMVRNIINNQRNYFATLINEENFGHFIYELNNNPEYVYKCILDYGRINNNNSQYIETLDYLLREYEEDYHAISQMINWSLEDGSITTSNYMIDNFIKRDYFGNLFNPLLSTESRETIVNALTYYFSSKIHLNLDFKEIGGEGLKAMAEALKRNSTITSLDLSSENSTSDIPDDAIDEGLKAIVEALKDNSTLTSLYICARNIGAEICEAIAEALKHNSSFTSLHLNTGYITDEGLKDIGEALKHNPALTSFVLCFVNVVYDGLKFLAEGLKHNSTLTSLSINLCVTDEDLKAIAEALKHNSALTSLNLGENHMGDEGVSAIAELLKCNSTLTSLDLGSNSIGDEGLKTIAEALKHNPALTSLNLVWNNIGDEGAQTLAELLKCNSTLTSLDIGNNNIGAEGRKAIAEVLKHNTTITSLGIDKENIGDEGLALLEVLKHNSSLNSLSLGFNFNAGGGITYTPLLTGPKNLLKFNHEKTNLYKKAENAVKCLQKFAVYDAANNSTHELGSQENWQELKKAVTMYLFKPEAIKFVAREENLSVGETTAILNAAKYRKAAVLDNDNLACLYYDDNLGNALPWEMVEMIGNFYAASLSDLL